MKKKFLITSLLFTFLAPNTFASTFTDVTNDHPYYIPLAYLKEIGSINGYDDGSFKPYNQINRAELLKLLMESSSKELNATKLNCFHDVDSADWYAPYVCSAKEQGLVNGYDTGYFKPGQNINKVEALKILAVIYDWELPENSSEVYFYDTPSEEWYTPYIAYAKEKNYLEETSTLFKPGEEINRANISTILYKHLSRLEIGHSSYSESTGDSITQKYDFDPSQSTYTQLQPKDIQVELSWENSSYDLDMHFTKPLTTTDEDGNYLETTETLNYLTPFSEDEKAFINYGDKVETLYIDELENGHYRLSIELYSEQSSMHPSSPVVKLYNEGELIKIYKLEDYSNEEESPTLTEWNIFTITNLGDLTDFTPPI